MDEKAKKAGLKSAKVIQVRGDTSREHEDIVVAEQPLEMRIQYGPVSARKDYTLAVTMRTPGNDDALIRGFLFTEGIVERPDQIEKTFVQDFGLEDYQSVTAALSPDVVFLPETNQRHFYTTSSCGICGKASIEMVRQVTSFRLLKDLPTIVGSNLELMMQKMRAGQQVFARTGGIHAAALFNTSGELLALQEDVGRHNAVDKLIGKVGEIINFPLNNHVMIVSGRGGFELVQKAVVSGVAIFAAVGAPSSLAVELADKSDMTLIGFLRGDGYNIYSHPARVRL